MVNVFGEELCLELLNGGRVNEIDAFGGRVVVVDGRKGNATVTSVAVAICFV